MIDITPEYLRSLRTLTAAEVDVRARERARFDLTPAERLDNTTHRAAYEGARH
jgi:hypothetical protein